MNKNYLILGIAACALCLLKRKSASGIGKAPKRRIFNEISILQQKGIDMECKWDDLTKEEQDVVVNTAKEFHYKQPSQSVKPYGEAYYNNVRKMYIAISGIGRTDLAHEDYTITNANGDTILIYNDYGQPDDMLKQAYQLVQDMAVVDQNSAYWHVLLYIAQGGKLAWQSKRGKDGVLISRGVEDLFHKSAAERKERRSYLATEAKGGLTLDRLTHDIWESTGGYDRGMDDRIIYNAVEEAVLSCSSVKQAQEDILNLYLDGHRMREQIPDEDLPF